MGAVVAAALGLRVCPVVHRCGDAVKVDQYVTPRALAFLLLTVICNCPLFHPISQRWLWLYTTFRSGCIVRGRLYRVGDVVSCDG
jgi:hypothetical protein